MAVTQGTHVRAILFDACAYLISSADGPVAGDEDINVVRHALEQPQPNQVVLDRICGVQVGERNQDVRSMSSATRMPRSSLNSAAWPEACAGCSMIRT